MRYFFSSTFLLFSFFLSAQFKNGTITKLNGEVLQMRITEAMPYAISGVLKGKITSITADSIQGFHFEGNDYLSLKTQGMEHFEFAYKLKTLDEFELYGWREVFDPTSAGTINQDFENVYKYIKRQKDNRLRVFEYSKEGVEQIPFLNCPIIMQNLLKKYSEFAKLVDVLEAYERDCGIEMRSK